MQSLVRALFYIILLLVIQTSAAICQNVALSMGSGSASPGGTVVLGLSMAASGGALPSALQFTANYSATDVTAASAAAGASAVAAAKSLQCQPRAGSITCVLFGLNTTTIGNGIVANLTFTIASNTAASATSISLTGTSASNGAGTAIPATSSNGVISIAQQQPVVLSALACAPGTVNAPGTSACTVTLTAPAAAGGFSVALSSSNANVTLVASVVVTAGASSAGFTATAATVATDQTATITASANGVTRISTLNVSAPAQLASLACAPLTLSAGTAATCTLSLTKAAAAATTIALSRDNTSLTIPASALIAAGSASGTFSVTAGSVTTDQSATVTGTLNGQTRAATLTLSAPVQVASVACTPAIVLSGGTASCTVTLTRAAPVGAAVSLASNNAAVTIPAGVAVAAGAATATFTATSGAVTADQTATLTASFNGSSRSGTLTVTTQLQVASVSCAPASLSSGGTANCTVTLTRVATTGTVLALSSNNGAVSVPANVTVASGSLSAAFVATAGTVTSNQTAAVTATYNTSSQTAWISVAAPSQTAEALRFVPVTPCRVVDTRNPAGPFGAPAIAADSSRSFALPGGACGIPGTARAYSLNVTVVPHGTLGYLAIWPAGQPKPFVSTLNSVDGRVKAGAAIVPAGTAGAVSVYVTHETDVILDVNGYFVAATDPAALAFYPVSPCRIADTREPARGVLGWPPMAAGVKRTFPVLASACNVSTAARAYSLNFTVVPRGVLGYISTWPAGSAQPLVSTLNAVTGTIVANAAIVPAGNGGAIDVFAQHDTDLVIDINGYFAPPGPGGFSLYNLTPCRAFDTRLPAGGPILNGARDVNFLTSGCGVPAAARAFAVNATVVPPEFMGYISLWPQGTAQPFVSTLNAVDAAITSNMAIVPTNNGSISVYSSHWTQVILDISGYFAP